MAILLNRSWDHCIDFDCPVVSAKEIMSYDDKPIWEHCKWWFVFTLEASIWIPRL